MRKMINIICISILMLIVFACTDKTKNIEETETTIKEIPKVKVENIDISDIENKYTYQKIVYPRFTIDENTLLQKSLNELNNKFKKQAEEFKENGKEEIRNIAKRTEGAMYEYLVTTDVKIDDEKYLSMENEIYEFYMGAHGSHYLEGNNFDKITGKKLLLTDFIKDKEDLKNQILVWCEKNKVKCELYDDYKRTVEEKFAGELSLEFLITKTGIQVIFQEYDLGPYASGPMHIDISLK